MVTIQLRRLLVMKSTSEVIQISPEVQSKKGSSIVELGLFFLGSYVIALLLSSAVHEIGHGLAMSTIPINYRLVLNPFSSSMAMPLSSIPTEIFSFVLSAGTILELLFGTVVVALFWRWRSTKLVPLLMIAPTSYLTSAGYFLIGTAIIEGDTALLIEMGVPALVMQILGVLMLVFGVIFLVLLFPLLGLSRDDSFRKVAMILFIGLVLHGFGMIIFALLFSPLELYIGIANVISMSVTVLVLSAIFLRGGHFLERISQTKVAVIERSTVLYVIGLAMVFIVAELIFFN